MYEQRREVDVSAEGHGFGYREVVINESNSFTFTGGEKGEVMKDLNTSH